jgi:DNA-binding NtrC family response regulator
MRVGARSTRPIDVRFVAATNRDLEADVANGLFREDLFFRLNGLGLTIPPLRDRPVELEPLARSFVASACQQMERSTLALSDAVIECLRTYRWPGNVRELRNVMERAVVLCSGPRLEIEHLPDAVVRADSQSPIRRSEPPSYDSSRPTLSPEVEHERFQAEIRSLERLRIMEALRRCGGNQTQAAQMLGMSRRTLVSRMGEFNLPRPRGGRKITK